MKKLTVYILPLLTGAVLSGCSGAADVQSGINDPVSQSGLSTESFYEEDSESSSSDHVISGANTASHLIEGFYLGESYEEVLSSSDASQNPIYGTEFFFNTGHWKDWIGTENAYHGFHVIVSEATVLTIDNRSGEYAVTGIETSIDTPLAGAHSLPGDVESDSLNSLFGEPVEVIPMGESAVEYDYALDGNLIWFQGFIHDDECSFISYGLKTLSSSETDSHYWMLPEEERDYYTPVFHDIDCSGFSLIENGSYPAELVPSIYYDEAAALLDASEIPYTQTASLCSPYTDLNDNEISLFEDYLPRSYLRLIYTTDYFQVQCDGIIPCVSEISVTSPELISPEGLKTGLKEEEILTLMGTADSVYETDQTKLLEYKIGDLFLRIEFDTAQDDPIAAKWSYSVFSYAEIQALSEAQNTLLSQFE